MVENGWDFIITTGSEVKICIYIYIHTSYGPRIEDIAENKHHRFSIPMGAGGPRLATHKKKNRLPFDERFKQIAL